MNTHYVFLVPGFFGFSNLGGITYFHHVREVLEEGFSARGLKVVAKGVSTSPTGSIRARAARLAEQIMAEVEDLESATIHLVGHSTGGLDTRMLVSPAVALRTEVDVEALAERVKSVVTVSTPHYGTPIAHFFNGLMGQNLLAAISLGTIYTLRFGRLPLRAIFELMGMLTRLDRRFGLENTILEQFYEELFADFTRDRAMEIRQFLGEVHSDRAAMGQLTPGSMDATNATTSDRPGIKYGSVITRAAGPSLEAALSARFEIYAHASHALFRLLQFLTARKGHYFDLHPEQEGQLVAAYETPPTCHSNDGVVPTLSQVWGEVIHITQADHLDVCGHFRDPGHDPPHVDWFISGSGFRRPQFEALWEDVCQFLVG